MSDDPPVSSYSPDEEELLSDFQRHIAELAPKESRPGELFFAPLGEFILEFNLFEMYLGWVLTSLSLPHSSEAGMLPLANVKNTADRVRLLHQMARRRFPDTRLEREATRVFKAMKKLNSYRNALIHGEWRSKGASASGHRDASGKWDIQINYSATVVYYDSSNDGEFQAHSPTPDQIKEHTCELSQLARDLWKLGADIEKQNRVEHAARARKAAPPVS